MFSLLDQFQSARGIAQSRGQVQPPEEGHQEGRGEDLDGAGVLQLLGPDQRPQAPGGLQEGGREQGLEDEGRGQEGQGEGQGQEAEEESKSCQVVA